MVCCEEERGAPIVGTPSIDMKYVSETKSRGGPGVGFEIDILKVV